MPVGIRAGGKDAVVPPQSVLRLAEAIEKTNNNVKLIYRENGGHATDYEDTVAALEFVVQAAGVGVPGGKIVAEHTAREGSIAAAEVKAGAVVRRHKAAQPETATAFYVRLANRISPSREPVVVALRARSGLRSERVAIQVYGRRSTCARGSMGASSRRLTWPRSTASRWSSRSGSTPATRCFWKWFRLEKWPAA